MSMHFIEGFVIATLICQMWGQFPRNGKSLKAFASYAQASVGF